jgi:hypothetical protein
MYFGTGLVKTAEDFGSLTHAAFPAHSGLSFLVSGASVHPPIPYFPQGIAGASVAQKLDDGCLTLLDLTGAR